MLTLTRNCNTTKDYIKNTHTWPMITERGTMRLIRDSNTTPHYIKHIHYFNSPSFRRGRGHYNQKQIKIASFTPFASLRQNPSKNVPTNSKYRLKLHFSICAAAARTRNIHRYVPTTGIKKRLPESES